MSPLSIDRQTFTTGHVHEAVHERTASYDHMPKTVPLSVHPTARPTPGAAARNFFRVVLACKVRFCTKH